MQTSNLRFHRLLPPGVDFWRLWHAFGIWYLHKMPLGCTSHPSPSIYQMRSITHFSLYFNLLCRQPILTHYACFGLSYFYYDIVVMFIGACLEEKHENPQGHLHYTHVWSKLYKKKKLIIIHHLLLPIFGFPAITVSFSYKNNSIWNQPNLVNNQKDELECSVRKFAWLFPQESYIKLMCRKENQINNKNIAWNIKCWNPGHIENPTFVFTNKQSSSIWAFLPTVRPDSNSFVQIHPPPPPCTRCLTSINCVVPGHEELFILPPFHVIIYGYFLEARTLT